MYSQICYVVHVKVTVARRTRPTRWLQRGGVSGMTAVSDALPLLVSTFTYWGVHIIINGL